MLQIDKTIRKPYYVQIYEYYRHEIEERRMVAGMRLSSVRELAQSVNVSKMTVEKAYYQLASEGISFAGIRHGMKWLLWAVLMMRPELLQCGKIMDCGTPRGYMILAAGIWIWNTFPSTYGENI